MHIYAFDLNCINLQKVNIFWSLIVKHKHFFLLKDSFQTAYVPLKKHTKTEIHLNLLNSMVFTLTIIFIVLMMNERYVYVLYIYKKHRTTRH